VIEDVSAGVESGEEVLVRGGRTFAVTRLDSDAWITAFSDDGTVDTSWATSGKRLVPMAGTSSTVEDALIDGAGRIVIAGTASTASTTKMQMVRVGPTGTLDTAFAGDGTFDAVTQSSGPTSVSRRGNGYVLTGGLENSLVVAAVRRDGTRVTAFAKNGVRRVPIVTESAITVRDVSVEPSGQVVAVAETTTPRGDREITLLRYRKNGTPDPTFGQRGIATTAIRGSDLLPDAVRRDAVGRYLVSFVIDDGTRHFTALARFTPTGRPDSTFGPDGRRILVPDLLDTSAQTRFALDDVGRAVVATQRNDDEVLVARVRANGTLDPTFGEGGAIIIDRSLSSAWNLRQIAVLTTGRIALADMGARRIVHLRSDGSLDLGYALGGARDMALDGSFADAAVAFGANGDLVAVASELSTDTRIARLTSDASLDASFGTAGILTIPAAPTSSPQVTRAVLRNDGSVVFTGFGGGPTGTFTGYGSMIGVVAPNGVLDASFSGDGIARIDVAPQRADIAVALAVRGRRAVVGVTVLDAGERLALARVVL
jgi:uncharacterized delta-60 repeat protein